MIQCWPRGRLLSALNQHHFLQLRAPEQVQLWERRWWLMSCASDLRDSMGVSGRKTSSLHSILALSLPKELSMETVKRLAPSRAPKVIRRSPRVNVSFTIVTPDPSDLTLSGVTASFQTFSVTLPCTQGATLMPKFKYRFAFFCAGCGRTVMQKWVTPRLLFNTPKLHFFCNFLEKPLN